MFRAFWGLGFRVYRVFGVAAGWFFGLGVGHLRSRKLDMPDEVSCRGFL